MEITGKGKTRTVEGLVVEHNGVKLEWPSFVVHTENEGLVRGFVYTLEYGFAKSLQDSVSGDAKRLKDRAAAIVKARADDTLDDLEPEYEDGEPETAAEIEAKLLADMTERRDDISVGKVSSRGPKLRPVERYMRDVAIANLRAIVRDQAAKGIKVKWPKKVKGQKNVELENAITKYMANPANNAKVRAEAERRMAADAAVELPEDTEETYFGTEAA